MLKECRPGTEFPPCMSGTDRDAWDSQDQACAVVGSERARRREQKLSAMSAKANSPSELQNASTTPSHGANRTHLLINDLRQAVL